MKVENISLDKDNYDFNKAFEFIQETDQLVYLTGKAGTGKTTFLKYVKETIDKNIVILAPTGVAAINAGGVTINSFFHIPFGPFVPDDSRLRTNTLNTENKESIFSTFKYNQEKRDIIKNLELLIIDEISMVRADTLDVVDKILRVFRGKPGIPFGGVQVILIGDTFQLPPIADNDQWDILSEFYKTPFFFSSRVVEENTPIYIELKKVYRQNEIEFIELLNRVRINSLTENDFQILNSKYDPLFSGNGNDYIILATHNKIVDETNLTKLNQLESELFTFEANVTDDFPERNMPTDHYLKLKVGAQIMFIKNDIGEYKRYYNGKIGKIKELGINSIKVIFDDESEVIVERSIWKNIQYTYNKEKNRIEEKTIGTFEQFPIRLAWAITVHKSQGLTFEKVIADLGKAFASGQVYVALSRCTSLSGLKLKTELYQNAIKTDPNVLEFARNETPGTLITELLKIGKADSYYKRARKHFVNGNIKLAYDNLKKALKFRNDFDTETFERYIDTHFTRLFNQKRKFLSLINENKQAKIQTYKDKELISVQASQILDKEEKISSLNSALDLEIQNRTDVEWKNTELKIDLEILKEELSNAKKQIHQLEKDLTKTINELKSKNEENELNKTEILRLNKLTWYNKLFGKS